MRLARPAAGLFGVAAVTLFFSEFVFANEGPVNGLLQGGLGHAALHLAGLTLFYALFALVFAAALSLNPGGGLAAVLLAGAVLGWAIEGMVIPVVYEAVPFSFLWTSIAWHTVIDVGVGLVILPLCLQARRRWIAPVAFAATGLFWGYWMTWTWADAAPLDLAAQAQVVGLTYPLLPLGLAGLAVGGATLQHMPVWLRWSVLAAGGLLAAAVGAPFLPWPLVLAMLVALTVLALRGLPPRGEMWARLAGPIRYRRLGWSLLTPGCAVLSYALCLRAQTGIDFELPALFLVLVGGVALPALVAFGLWHLGRRKAAG